MSAKHTPAPWVVANSFALDSNGERVAMAMPREMPPERAEEDANARLIAAAPELLEALIEAVECSAYGTNSTPASWLGQALNAIEKAGGEV